MCGGVQFIYFQLVEKIQTLMNPRMIFFSIQTFHWFKLLKNLFNMSIVDSLMC